MKTLVIGSKGHSRAHCIDWLQPFPNIEEYDSVVINLQSLSQEIFDKIHSKISEEMLKEISSLLFTEREVFCITDEPMTPTPPPSGFKSVRAAPDTNYDWLPVTVLVTSQKPGTSIDLIDKRFEEYFGTIGQWTHILDLYQVSHLKMAIQQILVEFFGEVAELPLFQLLPIAVNKSKKTIAGTVVYRKRQTKGGIHLLPPPTKGDSYQAIEILLDLVYGERGKKAPPWREEIEVPGVKEYNLLIEGKLKDMEKIQESILPLRREMEELDAFRDLLSASGEELEAIVQKALLEVGIPTKKTEKGFPVDLISNKVAVEVTGIKGSLGVDSEKVNQTGRFRQNLRKNEKIILIANTHMGLKPLYREDKTDFTPEVKKFFDAIDVCYMTSKTLFELWKDIRINRRKADTVTNKILSHKGELTLRDFRK